MGGLVESLESVSVYLWEDEDAVLLGEWVRFVRGRVHSAELMVREMVLVEEGCWNVVGLPVRAMIRVELGSSTL